MSDEIEIRIPGRPRHAATVRAFFKVLVRTDPDVRLSPREAQEMQLVLQEALVNAIRHGSARGGADLVRVVFRLEPDGLTVEVHDRGVGFDPDAVPPPDADALQEGGYGVFIMKQAMDRFEARRTPEGFMLSMTKRYRTAAAAGAGE